MFSLYQHGIAKRLTQNKQSTPTPCRYINCPKRESRLPTIKERIDRFNPLC